MSWPAAIAIMLAAFALALGYALQSFWVGVALILLVALLRLLAQWRSWSWVADLALVGLIGLAAFGAWAGLAAGWMLAGVVAALAAWDLDHFFEQLRDRALVRGADALIRAHLRRLLLVAGAGLLLGAIALGVRVEISFGWALLVGAIALISLSRVIGGIR